MIPEQVIDIPAPDAIPPAWLERLVMRERIVELADGLYELATS